MRKRFSTCILRILRNRNHRVVLRCLSWGRVSILSALYGYLNGAGAVYLMDVGRFASTNLSIYKTAYEKWCAKNVMK